MQLQYTLLATIQFKHRYFRDGLFKPVEISWVKDRSKFIPGLGLIIKPISGGFHLLSADPGNLERLEHGSILVHFGCKDPNYINYTALNTLNLSNKLFYFNNLNDNPATRGTEICLHREEYAGEEDIVDISRGQIEVPNYNPNIRYQLFDVLGHEITEENLQPDDRHKEIRITDPLNEGLLHLFANDVELKRVYYTPDTKRNVPMGVLEINLGKLSEHYRTHGKVGYTINFGNRRTIWKYFMVSPQLQQFNNLSIINEGKELLFTAPKIQTHNENSEALVFESKDTLPLSELYADNFQLVADYDPVLQSGRVIIKNLPNSSPEHLYHDNTNPQQPKYSHIYIY